MEWLAREEMLIGKSGIVALQRARVAVLGLGGVGGAAAEALVRAGVGSLLVVDYDTVEPSNLNRQVFATIDMLGKKKTEAARRRLLNINPELDLQILDICFGPETAEALFGFRPSFVIDAIDMVSAKLLLAQMCHERGVPLICSMGTGNRVRAGFKIGPVSETAGCGCALARVMRRELRKRALADTMVLYSTEQTIQTGQRTPGSISFVPPVAGLLLAGYVVEMLLKK